MGLKQGLLFFIVGTGLSLNMVFADEVNPGNEVKPRTDFSGPSTVISPEIKTVLAETKNFAGKLQTTGVYATKKSEKVAATKVDLSKTMISKFRINGI